MVIYTKGQDGRLEVAGYVNACSIYDLLGKSFVHILDERRDGYGLPHEPYDWLFDTYREALDWADRMLGGIAIGY